MKILPDAQPPTQLVETSSWLISRTTCDLSRIAEPTEADYQRIEKYQRAIKLTHAI
jgi:hypothetical protein